MRVFLDTNVLISNFMWGGVCAQVVEVAASGHSVVTGEFVLEETKRVLFEKFSVPNQEIQEYTSVFRRYHVEPHAENPYEIPIDDPSDPWILAAAVNAEAQVLVTGDKPFQSANPHVGELIISSPREFLKMTEDE